MHGNALLVARDDEILGRLRTAVVDANGKGREIKHVDLVDCGDRVSAKHTKSIPVFVDLRIDSSWEAIEKLAARDEMPMLIGIVESGFALSRVVLAEKMLSGAISVSAEGEFDQSRFGEVLERAPQRHREVQRIREDGSRTLKGPSRSLATWSPSMFPVFRAVERAARDDSTVLLEGESGTGKTTLAEMFHDLSARSGGPFLAVPCGGLKSELVDSQLFGHVKGAFTGADRNRVGKFEAARGGTILLDEIDVLTAELQAKLLRTLDRGEFEALGSSETRYTDARVIVASNRHLDTLKDTGEFRADLYFRLKQIQFELPPLRKRLRDIVPTAVQVVQEHCERRGQEPPKVHPDVIELLRAYAWPGNIRELKHEVGRAVLFSDENLLSPHSLSQTLADTARMAVAKGTGAAGGTGLTARIEQAERDIILRVLEVNKQNCAAASRELGVSRVTFYNKLKKLNITPKRRGNFPK